MKNILPVILIVAAIAGITIYSQKSKKSEQKNSHSVMEKMEKTNSMMIEDKMAMEKEAMMKVDDKILMDKMEKSGDAMMEKKDDSMMMEKEAMVEKPGSFVKYEDVNIASLNGDIVLDFSATWCPSCRSFKKDVEASLSDIPSNLTIVLVDYDSNKDLRKKYGVTRQHTFVQIDKQGNQINKWSGGSTLESLFSHIK